LLPTLNQISYFRIAAPAPAAADFAACFASFSNRRQPVSRWRRWQRRKLVVTGHISPEVEALLMAQVRGVADYTAAVRHLVPTGLPQHAAGSRLLSAKRCRG
jgi:hypothetical protein